MPKFRQMDEIFATDKHIHATHRPRGYRNACAVNLDTDLRSSQLACPLRCSISLSRGVCYSNLYHIFPVLESVGILAILYRNNPPVKLNRPQPLDYETCDVNLSFLNLTALLKEEVVRKRYEEFMTTLHISLPTFLATHLFINTAG